MRRLILLSVVLSTLLLTANESARTQGGTNPSLGTVGVYNFAPYPRNEVITTVVPFLPNTYHGEPLQTSTGTPVAVEQFGPLCDDGSWRTAKVSFPIALSAQQYTRLELRPSTAQQPPFVYSPAIVDALGKSLTIALSVGKNTYYFGSRLESVAASFSVKGFEEWGRVPNTPIWCHLRLEFYSNQEYCRFWLHYGDCDPSISSTNHTLPAIRLHVLGDVFSAVRHNKALSANPYLLDAGSTWLDGESQLLTGTIVPRTASNLQSAQAELLINSVASAEWTGTGQFSPWGDPPPLPVAPQLLLNDAVNSYRGFTNDTWQAPIHGCLARPGATGAQNDFSSVVLTATAHGYPYLLFPVQRSVYQEACRPIFTIDPYTNRLIQYSKYPGIHLWDSSPFFTSPNKQPLGAKVFPNGAQFYRVQGSGHRGGSEPWWGHDRQHYSINYLTTYARQTGDPGALWLVAYHGEVLYNLCPIHSGNVTLDSQEAARAVGRTLQSMTNVWFCTGSPLLKKRISDRVDVSFTQWNGKNNPSIRPLVIYGPDNRILNGTTSFVKPWEESIAITGLSMTDNVFHLANAKTLVEEVGRTNFQYGIIPSPDGQVGTLNAYGYPSLQPEWPMNSPTQPAYHMFDIWSGPAAEIMAMGGNVRAQKLVNQLRLAPFTWSNYEWLGIPPMPILPE